MRRLLIIVALLLVGCGSAQAQIRVSSWPTNNLWVEDQHNFVTDYADQQTFNKIIDLGYQLYAPVAQRWGERLVIQKLWNNSDVNAQAYRDGRGYAEVAMFGGMARRSEVNKYSFALVLCHELSHLYSGKPYLDQGLMVSAEGQSDWGGAGWCLRNITEKLPDDTALEVTQYMQKSCNGNSVCLRRLAGANGLGRLLSVLSGEPVPRFETPDPTQVWQTELSYPRSVQCRLDSYFRGVMSYERPRCWYKP